MLLLSRHGGRSWLTCRRPGLPLRLLPLLCRPGLLLWLLPLLCRPGLLLWLLPLLCRPGLLLWLLPLLCRPGLLLCGPSPLRMPALLPVFPCMGGSGDSEKYDQYCYWKCQFHVCYLELGWCSEPETGRRASSSLVCHS
jgi:hypothetical protein